MFFSIHLKYCDWEDYLATNVLLNLDRFYSILATMKYFRVWKSAIMDHILTFRKRVYRSLGSKSLFILHENLAVTGDSDMI